MYPYTTGGRMGLSCMYVRGYFDDRERQKEAQFNILLACRDLDTAVDATGCSSPSTIVHNCAFKRICHGKHSDQTHRGGIEREPTAALRRPSGARMTGPGVILQSSRKRPVMTRNRHHFSIQRNSLHVSAFSTYRCGPSMQ